MGWFNRTEIENSDTEPGVITYGTVAVCFDNPLPHWDLKSLFLFFFELFVFIIID